MVSAPLQHSRINHIVMSCMIVPLGVWIVPNSVETTAVSLTLWELSWLKKRALTMSLCMSASVRVCLVAHTHTDTQTDRNTQAFVQSYYYLCRHSFTDIFSDSLLGDIFCVCVCVCVRLSVWVCVWSMRVHEHWQSLSEYSVWGEIVSIAKSGHCEIWVIFASSVILHEISDFIIKGIHCYFILLYF